MDKHLLYCVLPDETHWSVELVEECINTAPCPCTQWFVRTKT